MKIAVAQIQPVKGNIALNTEVHRKFIEHAIALNTDAIFFPELSLTGYEPELAKALALKPDDPRLSEFQGISDVHNITIGLGAPVGSDRGIWISMLIFQPQLQRQKYSKQMLHSDELPYFIPGDNQLLISVYNRQIAPAICYESLQVEHSDKAYGMGAEIYLASVAKSRAGLEKALKHYPEVAANYAMPVLMSNSLGPCDNFESVGGSAAWTSTGKLVGQLGEKSAGILIFDTDTENVITKLV